MRPAPPVTVVAAPCRRTAWLVPALAALAAAACITTACAHLEWPAALALVCAALAAAVAAALSARWLPRHAMRLQWDGVRWRLAMKGGNDSQAGEIAVMMDLGNWMLLRFDAEGRGSRRWLPLRSAEARMLRPALYASRPEPGDAAVR
jgi:hypothetical protein